jgi:hypothetical protein
LLKRRRHLFKVSRFIFLIPLVAAELAAPRSLNAEPTNGLGMWVWSRSACSTRDARQKLVHFSLKHHITHLDVHTRMSRDKEKPALQNAEALRDLILLAGQYHITTAILRGDPKMFFSENHDRALRELRAIIAFSKTLPAHSGFEGIKYDVEPYLTKEWKLKEESRKEIMRDYLAFLRKARSVLGEEAPHLWLAADTPFWWDNDEFILEFEGRRKRFSEHVQDLTDFITIMSYRRSSQEVLKCVAGERKYARRIRKVIIPSLETVELKKTPNLSFWGAPAEEFWKVVPELLETAKGDPAVGGLMIHCYRSLAEKLNQGCSPTGEKTPDSFE